MKKIITLLFFLSLIGEVAFAQKKGDTTKMLKFQFGINATHLIGQATGLRPLSLTRSNLYDLRFSYSSRGKKSFHFDFGYEIPEGEVPSGAVAEANSKLYTLHFKMGVSWNKRFLEKWVLRTGPDIIYSNTTEKEFKKDQLSEHSRISNTGFGITSNLQYYFTPQFSIGVEGAFYASVRVRKRIFPSPFNPNPNPNPDPFFIDFDFIPFQARFFAPVELFVYYSF